MIKQLVLATSPLVLLGGLTAQSKVLVTGETMSTIGVYAAAGKTNQYKAVRKGTKILRPLGVRAVVRGAAASTAAAIGSRGGAVFATVTEAGQAVSTTSKGSAVARTSKGAKPEAEKHIIAFKFVARAATKGKLHVHLSGAASKGAGAAGAVYLDRRLVAAWDTTKRPVKKELDLTVDAKGKVVTVVTFAAAGVRGKARAGYGARAYVGFVPAGSMGWKVTPYGRSCSVLAGAVRTSGGRSVLGMKLTGAPKKALGITIIGAKQLSIPIRGTQCFFRTDLLGIGGIFRTDDKGNATHMLGLPARRGLSFNVQDIVLTLGRSGLGINTSNGLAVSNK